MIKLYCNICEGFIRDISDPAAIKGVQVCKSCMNKIETKLGGLTTAEKNINAKLELIRGQIKEAHSKAETHLDVIKKDIERLIHETRRDMEQIKRNYLSGAGDAKV